MVQHSGAASGPDESGRRSRTSPPKDVQLKRAYAPPEPSDGFRVLVDRLWPRGLKKADAAIDLWLRDVAPSSELRRWFGHRPDRWAEFRDRYRAELKGNPALAQLRGLGPGRITLVYAAKDETHNQARVLLDILQGDDRGPKAVSEKPWN